VNDWLLIFRVDLEESNHLQTALFVGVRRVCVYLVDVRKLIIFAVIDSPATTIIVETDHE